MKDDLDKYLEKKPEKEKEEERKEEEVNPFAALFSFSKSEKKKTDEEELEPEKKGETKREGIKADSFNESVVRKLAEMQAAEGCFNLFNIYKKTHDMAAPQRDVDFWEFFQAREKKGF